MSKQQKAIVDTAIMAYNLRTLASSLAKVGGVVRGNASKHGVRNRLYSKKVLKALQKSWQTVAKEESEKNAFFKKVYEDLTTFMDKYQAYECLGYSALPSSCDK
jgi:TRAP-type mannitol/chloroaromatic compound transport system substrate-binding protein